MKKTILFLLIFPLWLTFSCNSESDPIKEIIEVDPDNSKNALLIGNWTLVSVEAISGNAMLDIFGTVTNRDFVASGIELDANLDFLGDPKSFTSTGKYQLMIEVTSGGSTGFIIDDFFGSGLWELNGDILTTTSDNVESLHNILELTNENLKIKTDVNFEFNEVNRKATINGALIYSLEKNN